MSTIPPNLQPLQPYIQAITPYLDKYGYAAVFVGVLLESFGIPLPGETLLIGGSLFAAIGNFHVVWVFLLGLTAAVIGDNIGYAIGYYGGRALVLRYGRIPGRHALLYRDRAARRIDDGWEFDQQAVAHRLDDAPTMLGDRGIYEFRAMLS